jgi:hypothetical protein
MFAGSILIKLKNGDQINYVNKYLIKKTGDDGAGNTKYEGEPCHTYMWTGRGNDKLSDQTGKGKIIGDYDYIINQFNIETEDYIMFPEINATTHGDTEDLIRHNNDFYLANTEATITTKIKAGNIASIELITRWIYSPFDNKEGSYVLPTDNPYFRGTTEYMDQKIAHKSDLIDMNTDPKSSIPFNYPKQLLKENR